MEYLKYPWVDGCSGMRFSLLKMCADF